MAPHCHRQAPLFACLHVHVQVKVLFTFVDSLHSMAAFYGLALSECVSRASQRPSGKLAARYGIVCILCLCIQIFSVA